MKSLFILETDVIISHCRSFVDDYAGSSFLQELTIFLCSCFDVSYALIGYIDEDPNKIKTAAMAVRGQPVESLSYSLKGTPCEDVVGKNSCFFPSGVQRLFPEDEELKTLGIESYFGSPLVCSKNMPLGLIALMDTKKFVQGSLLDKALAIVTPRAEKELMRMLQVIPN